MKHKREDLINLVQARIDSIMDGVEVGDSSARVYLRLQDLKNDLETQKEEYHSDRNRL